MCKDVVQRSQLADLRPWHDAKNRTCKWYANGFRCATLGEWNFNDGFVADSACCVCGGGCVDKALDAGAEWYDSQPAGMHCSWYAVGDRCAQFGHTHRNHGLTANEACCACGGGKRVSTSADAMSPIPTPSPPQGQRLGLCCRQPCSNSSDCAGESFFCCPIFHKCMDKATHSTA